MRVKLLKRLRKRFEIWQEDDLYFLVDWESLNEDNVFPYKYVPSDNLEEAKKKRRELILSTFEKQHKIKETLLWKNGGKQ